YARARVAKLAIWRLTNTLSGISLVWSIGVILLASCQTSRFVDTIPPSNLTKSSLIFTYHRIQNFWNEHGRVPATADELPEVADLDCSMKDGWGRNLNWDSDGHNRVRVWSVGRDGKPGGTGDDADMEFVFIGKEKGQEDLATITTSDGSP